MYLINLSTYLLFIKSNLQPENTSECSTPAETVSCEPTDSVVDESGGAGIPLPGTSTQPPGDARAFFSFQKTIDDMFSSCNSEGNALVVPTAQPGSSSDTHNGAHPTPSQQRPQRASMSLESLRRPLKLPLAVQEKGLTRSQLLFSIATSIDARALKISGDDEFYLFMDMRAEHQWASFGMTAVKWASATQAYNIRLETLGKEKRFQVIKKSPRALVDKLNEVEPKIIERIRRKNYTCTFYDILTRLSLLTD